MNTIDELVSLLCNQYDFWPSPRNKSDLYFSGKFIVGGTEVVIELRFITDFLLEPPEAWILDWSHNKGLRLFLGSRHINKDGQICFYDLSRDVWDATVAIRHVAGVIDKITGILNENISKVQDDSWLLDFDGYWRGPKSC